MCHSAEMRLRCSPESVAVGRHFVTDAIVGWGVGDADPAWSALGDVTFVASELLGNAAAAGTNEMTIVVETHRDRVRLVVFDDSEEPAIPQPQSEMALGSRGLAIVATLSERWGQSEFDGRTKVVWAVVPVPDGSVLAQGCAL